MNWFLTQNFQIIDLYKARSFWIEKCPDNHSVFCKYEDECEWRIAEFAEEEQAREYITCIFDKILSMIPKESKKRKCKNQAKQFDLFEDTQIKTPTTAIAGEKTTT